MAVGIDEIQIDETLAPESLETWDLVRLNSNINNIRGLISVLDLQDSIVSSIQTICTGYSEILQHICQGDFDYIPEIQKYKNLINHDLAKPYNELGSIVSFLNFFKEADDFNNLFTKFSPGLEKYIQQISGCLNILDEIVSAYQNNIESILSLEFILDSLQLLPLGNNTYETVKNINGIETKTEVSFVIPFDIQDRSLTLEEFFSLHTVLINAIAEEPNEIIVTITDGNNMRTICIADDKGFAWPQNLNVRYMSDYFVSGYVSQDDPITAKEKGLGMVFYLAGQRNANFKIPAREPLVRLIDGNEVLKFPKYLSINFPRSI